MGFPKWQVIVCGGECLKQYEQGETTQEKPLFQSYVGPVTSRRLAHWVKDLLERCGVDGAFKAHSVWGVSTSAIMARGVSLAGILDTADWSRESTFQQFYYRKSNSTTYVAQGSPG